MKRIEIEGLATHVEELVAVAPRERVLLTRHGKPFAIVTDASAYDEEDIGYMSDPKFWQMIQTRRRARGGISLEQVEARIERDAKAEKSATTGGGSKKRKQ